MSETTELYTGPDRGHFKILRLPDNAGVQMRVNCRLKEVSVFNYLSELQYAIVGYSVEWWPEGELPPHEGGEANPYIPYKRPNINKLYFRTKTSITPKMLYLEDAIINDFMNNKVLSDPMTFLTYTLEAKEQTDSAAIWRELERTPFQYANAVHITRLEATSQTPLTVISEGMRFDYRRTASPDIVRSGEIKPYPFTKLRDCYGAMQNYIQNEVDNGRF